MKLHELIKVISRDQDEIVLCLPDAKWYIKILDMCLLLLLIMKLLKFMDMMLLVMMVL